VIRRYAGVAVAAVVVCAVVLKGEIRISSLKSTVCVSRETLRLSFVHYLKFKPKRIAKLSATP
jgi:hypothetical protein